LLNDSLAFAAEAQANWCSSKSVLARSISTFFWAASFVLT
jgi:hypothetical protein